MGHTDTDIGLVERSSGTEGAYYKDHNGSVPVISLRSCSGPTDFYRWTLSFPLPRFFGPNDGSFEIQNDRASFVASAARLAVVRISIQFENENLTEKNGVARARDRM
jgi:hypothetical protein